MVWMMNKCLNCGRPLRPTNIKSFCQPCAGKAAIRKKFKTICGICQEPCSGKLQIQFKVNATIVLCQYHFTKLNQLNDMKEIRKEIIRLKKL